MSINRIVTIFLAVMSVNLYADPVTDIQVLGISANAVAGNRNPAQRHRDCARTFSESHWCSTQEYLDGGVSPIADFVLPTAWIRPTVVGGYAKDDGTLQYIDIAGIKTTESRLNCLQWGSSSSNHRGFALQTTANSQKQRIVQLQCNRKRHSLCCGSAEQ